MVVPKLRFPEFKNNWNTYLLSERVNEIIGGGTPSTKNKSYWNGNIPWFSSSDVQINKLFNPIPTRFISKEAVTNSATSIIPQDSISIVSRVGVGKLAFIQHDYCTSQDFQSLVGFKDRPIFLSYLLQKELIKLSMMTQGTSIKGITKVELANLKINVPSISEQNKIEKLLISLDKKIQLQQEKIDLLKEQKKGFMQKIFSQEFRFKDEDGQDFPKWTTNILTHFALVNPKSEELSPEFRYIDLEAVADGELLSTQVISKHSAPSRAQRVVRKGDILYQTVRPYQKNNLLYTHDFNEQVVASTGYAQIKAKENTDSAFLYQLMNTEKFTYFVLQRCTGTSYPAINSSDLGEIEIQMPVLKEQQKIAIFLSKVDKKITIERNKLKILHHQKQAFMQQIFI